MKKIFVIVAIALMLLPMLSIAETVKEESNTNTIMPIEKEGKTTWFNTTNMVFEITVVPLGNHIYYYSYKQDLHTPNLIRVAWTKGAGRFWYD